MAIITLFIWVIIGLKFLIFKTIKQNKNEYFEIPDPFIIFNIIQIGLWILALIMYCANYISQSI